MNVKIDESWNNMLQTEFQKPYFEELTSFIRSEYSLNTCFPPGNQIFAAFDHCDF